MEHQVKWGDGSGDGETYIDSGGGAGNHGDNVTTDWDTHYHNATIGQSSAHSHTRTTAVKPDHTHTRTTGSAVSGVCFDIHPPYVKLVYIMKM
jgi:hypothetical protein